MQFPQRAKKYERFSYETEPRAGIPGIWHLFKYANFFPEVIEGETQNITERQ